MTLTQLGHKVEIPDNPDKAQLELVTADWLSTLFVARFICPEFTSLCPVTGQPDFAELIIDYVPAGILIESKSLKLFLASFRNYKGFHENTTLYIGDRLHEASSALYTRIAAYWKVRGGIAIDVFWESGNLPKGMTLPDNSYAVLRTRA